MTSSVHYYVMSLKHLSMPGAAKLAHVWAAYRKTQVI